MVVSHHHADHYGGMDAVIREFQPRFFLATDSSHTTPHYLKLLEAGPGQRHAGDLPDGRPPQDRARLGRR